jgi:hypothetical protein
MDESGRWIIFNLLNKSMISLSMMIRASGSSLGPHLKRDLVIYIYTLILPR